jgi:archaellum component FlaC
MNKLVFLLILIPALFLAAPASADKDSFARVQINKLEERAATLESQVNELSGRIDTLQQELSRQIQANYTLIRALAEQITKGEEVIKEEAQD